MATFFGGSGTTAFTVAANFVYFWPATCTLSGNVTDGRVYFSSGGASVKLAVYADSAGLPGTLLGVSNAIALGGAAGLKTTTFPTPFAVVNGTQYWLCWLFDTGCTMGGNSGGAVSYRFIAATYPTYPGSGAGSGAGSAYNLGLEVGVTAGGGGAVFVPLIIPII